MWLRRLKLILVILLAFGMIIPNVSAYTFTQDDDSDYSVANGVYSIWAFAVRSCNYDTGLIEVMGAWASASLHYAKLYIGMAFTAPISGRVHCSAKWTLNYKIMAGLNEGGYARLYIRYYLLSITQNELEFKKNIYKDTVTYESGGYETSSGIITEDGSSSVYWDYPLSVNTTYYAAVMIYIKLYYGGYAFSQTGTIISPTYVSLDVSEINIWS